MAALPQPTPLPSFPEVPALPLNTLYMNTPNPRLDARMAHPRLSPPLTAPTHARTEPAFASHMTDIFSAQIALEETLREEVRQIEATRLESKWKVQQTVVVYAWMEDGVVPVSFEVQERFVWPHFILNKAVLLSAGFTNISLDTTFNIFRFSLGHWTTVKVNCVVDVKDSSRVFIKASEVQHCQDFKKFLTTSLSTAEPNVRRNLAGERDHVKRKMLAHQLSQASKASTSKRPITVSSDEEPQIVMGYRPSKKSRSIAATRVVRRNMSEYAQMECYESDSGIEFTEPRPFSNQTRTPPRRSPSIASTSSQRSPSIASTSSQSVTPTIKYDLTLPFYIPPNDHMQAPRWPRDFFAIDIVNCFNDADKAGDGMVRQVFESHFGQWVPFVNSTFYEHRGRWQAASLEAKHAALSAGRAPAGYWANFMSANPAPRARLKAARRKLDTIDPIDEA